MEASRAATGMLDVLATRAVLFMIDSSLPSAVSSVNCKERIMHKISIELSSEY